MFIKDDKIIYEALNRSHDAVDLKIQDEYYKVDGFAKCYGHVRLDKANNWIISKFDMAARPTPVSAGDKIKWVWLGKLNYGVITSHTYSTYWSKTYHIVVPVNKNDSDEYTQTLVGLLDI